jgi:hypothetical protein
MNQLQEAARRREAAKTQLDAARSDVDAGIVVLLREGMKPADIAPVAGVSYEKIRTLARAHGIKQLREPTVTSRKPKKRTQEGDD